MQSVSKVSLVVALFVIAVCTTTARAADAYFVRFQASGQGDVVWHDDITFYNIGTAPATVRFLGVSNGAAQPDAPSLVLPPQKTIAVDAATGQKWIPVPAPPIWVLHLDVPQGVIADSRNQYYDTFGIPELFSAPRGKVPMPIVRELSAGGKPQVHLGTDLGGWDSRVNVVIYNAAAEAATATIEVRRACDDVLVDSRVVTVPPNTAVQAGGLGVGSSAGCAPATTLPWARNTIVTLTQPSFSFVSNINENISFAQRQAGTIPTVGLAVAINQQF